MADPALAPWIVQGDEGPEWDFSRCFPGVTLVIARATVDIDGAVISPAQSFPGWWMVISTDGAAPEAALTAIEPHRLAADRTRAATGEPFVFQQGLRAAPEQFAAVLCIDGAPAGSAYPWGAVSVIP